MKEMDDFEKNDRIDDLIDIFGQAIDEMLVENEVRMQITLPEGSMDPEIKSIFSKTGPVLDFYILLHALKKVVSDFLGNVNFSVFTKFCEIILTDKER